MRFEWDDEKDIANFKKHGVFFMEAKMIWTDRHSQEYFDVLHSVGEERFVKVGHSGHGRMLTVIFAENPERIRIISARRPTQNERKRYEEGI